LLANFKDSFFFFFFFFINDGSLQYILVLTNFFIFISIQILEVLNILNILILKNIYLKKGLNTLFVLIFVVFVVDGPYFDIMFKMVIILTECLK